MNPLVKIYLYIFQVFVEVIDDLGLFLKAGVELISPIIVGVFIGLFLDNYFNTKPLHSIALRRNSLGNSNLCFGPSSSIFHSVKFAID